MENSKILKGFLLISGALLSFIGFSLLFMPVSFKAGGGVDVAGDINTLNDIRASGGLFLATGLLSILGSFIKKISYTAALISPIVFLSVAGGRLLSIMIDGMPVEGLFKATIVELVIGVVGVFMFMKYQNKE